MRFGLVTCLLSVLWGGPLLAADALAFDVYLRGLRAGELTIDVRTEETTYALDGLLASSGFLSLMKTFRFDAATKGAVEAGAFRPWLYAEKAENGTRRRQSVMRYPDGVPTEIRSTPRKPRKWDVDPETQKGTVDPLTGLFLMLRDLGGDDPCARTVAMFDGTRASRIDLAQIRAATGAGADSRTCGGSYQRIAGYSPKDLDEQAVFPVKMTLRRAGDIWRVELVELDTLYGPGRLVRR